MAGTGAKVSGDGFGSSSSSSAVDGIRSILAVPLPVNPFAAKPAYQSTESLLLDLEGSVRSTGTASSGGVTGRGGDTGLGAALMCAGGALSPRTFPETGGALLSTVFAGRNLRPPWIERIRALTSPAGAGAGTAVEPDGAGGAGGGGGALGILGAARTGATGAGGGGGAVGVGVEGDATRAVEDDAAAD